MKQNLGPDGSSADFTIGKGKEVLEDKIIAKKRPISIFFDL